MKKQNSRVISFAVMISLFVSLLTFQPSGFVFGEESWHDISHIISNNRFDTGHVGWASNQDDVAGASFAAVSTPVRTGSGALSVTISGMQEFSIWQTIPAMRAGLTAGDTIRFGAWVNVDRNTRADSGHYTFSISAIDNTGVRIPLGDTQSVNATTPRGEWVHFETSELTIPANVVEFVVSFAGTMNGTFIIDEITLQRRGAPSAPEVTTPTPPITAPWPQQRPLRVFDLDLSTLNTVLPAGMGTSYAIPVRGGDLPNSGDHIKLWANIDANYTSFYISVGSVDARGNGSLICSSRNIFSAPGNRYVETNTGIIPRNAAMIVISIINTGENSLTINSVGFSDSHDFGGGAATPSVTARPPATTTTFGPQGTEFIKEYAIVNGSFDRPPTFDDTIDFSIYAPPGISYSFVTEGAYSPPGALSIRAANGGAMAMWYVLPIKGTEARDDLIPLQQSLEALAAETGKYNPEHSDRVLARNMMQLRSVSGPADDVIINLIVTSETPDGTKTVIGQSHPTTLNVGEWTNVMTTPEEFYGFIPANAIYVVMAWEIQAPQGVAFEVLIDDVRIGATEVHDGPIVSTIKTLDEFVRPKYYIVENNSFEDGLQGWTVSPGTTISSEWYWGAHSLQLNNTAGNTATATQDIRVAEGSATEVSAGVWVYFDDANSFNYGDIAIIVEEITDGGAVELSRANLRANATGGTWYYLKTPAAHRREDTEMIRITLQSRKEGATMFDFVQAGEFFSFNGNPTRMVMAVYIVYFGNEQEWHNWFHDGRDRGGVLHDPSRSIEVTGTPENPIFRPDGSQYFGTEIRRDAAVTFYPMIGIYDPNCKYVLAYHMDIAEAMGIDVLEFNIYGNLHPSFEVTLHNAAEVVQGRQLRLSLMYEPKQHVNGWVPHPSREAGIQAIIDEMFGYVQRFGNNKNFLHHDGRLVITSFGITTEGLSTAEWQHIKDELDRRSAEIGKGVSLMGDMLTGREPLDIEFDSMDSIFVWNMWTHALTHANEQEIYDFVFNLYTRTALWAIQRPNRHGRALVFPGFDDRPVMGWDAAVHRWIDLTGPEFYRQSWRAAIDHPYGFTQVLIATFNDWCEGHNIEPDRERGFEMAEMTREFINEFKGTNLPAGEVQRITEEFMRNPNARRL